MSDGEGQAKPRVLIDGAASVLTAHPTDGGKPYGESIFKCQSKGHTYRYLFISYGFKMFCAVLVSLINMINFSLIDSGT